MNFFKDQQIFYIYFLTNKTFLFICFQHPLYPHPPSTPTPQAAGADNMGHIVLYAPDTLSMPSSLQTSQ